MRTQKEIKHARNLLATVLLYDAERKAPEIFQNALEAHSAIFSAGVLYWLFGEDGEDQRGLPYHCQEHEAENFTEHCHVWIERLQAAGCADPLSDKAYRYLKERMDNSGSGLFHALTEIQSEPMGG